MSRPILQILLISLFFIFPINFSFSSDLEEIYKTRLNGWKGIVFICHEDSNINSSICNRIQTDAEFLATAAGINFVTEKEYSKVHEWQNEHHYLTLEASVHFMGTLAADNRCRTCAFSGGLKAYAYFLSGANLLTPKNSPMAFPRGGDFVLWQNSYGLAFTGSWDYGSDPFIKDIENKLKEFFTLFMKANPK